MLDSSSHSTTPTSRHTYLSSHANHHDQTLDSIRNAIASDSQRIRVQDESTGQSYELELGKEVAYPQQQEQLQRRAQDDANHSTSNGDNHPVKDTVRNVASNGSTFARSIRFGRDHNTSSSSSTSPSTNAGGSSNANASATSTHNLASSSSSNTPSASESANATPKRGGDNDRNGSAASTPASSTSASSSPALAAHKVLRLPLIVRHRNTATRTPDPPTAVNGNDTASASTSTSTLPSTATSLNPPQQPLPQQPFPKHSEDDYRDIAGQPGDVQLKELNRRYHESLKSSMSASQLSRQMSRDSSITRPSREGAAPGHMPARRRSSHNGPTAVAAPAPSSSTAEPSTTTTTATTTSASPTTTQYTAPPRHYPIMSELPPSPPLEADAEMSRSADKGILAGASAAVAKPAANGPAVDPSQRRRTQCSGSESTVYLSADEYANDRSLSADTADEAEEEGTPTTPTMGPTFNILRGSPDHMTQPLGRADSTSSSGTSKPTAPASSQPTPAPALPVTSSSGGLVNGAAATITPSDARLLHPASARAPSSPSKRGRHMAPPRGQPPRRNTTGSSTGSVESFGNSRPNSSQGAGGQGTPSWSSNLRRGSRDRWLPNGLSRRDSEGASGLSGAAMASSRDMIPTSTSMSGAGPLKTGDAGFDEEIAKHEALIRKRKERARREEEEKEKEQPGVGGAFSAAGLASGGAAGTSGMPALMRARSGVGGKAGGGGGSAEQASRQQQQADGHPSHQQLYQPHDEEKALKGNIINENHVNYVLMYNMLTGIRIGVSRCQAKIKRPLQDEDYMAKHKFTFDIIGNELTPSAKYDFKFKDYAPWVFRELREYFHLDPADYLLSLTAKYILSELGSPGKSGSFFYFSRDYRFIIKTIRHSEHKFLRRILKDYHEHVKANPHTLLSRFYGLHRVKLPHGRKIHFVIMNNLFPPHRDIHETYDLKGSSLGREYPEDKVKTKKGATMKDINWVRRRRELELGPQKRALFEAQLQSDVALLKRLNIMDYSLLIGLHDLKRGNSEGLRQEKLQVVQPESKAGGGNSGNANAGANGMTVSAAADGGGGGVPASVSVSEQPAAATAPAANQTSLSPPASSSPLSPSALPQIQVPTVNSPSTVMPTSPSLSSSPPRPTPGMARTGSTSTVAAAVYSEDEDGGFSASPTRANAHPHQHNQQQQHFHHHHPSTKRPSEKDAFALRAAVRRSDTKAIGSSSGAQLPARETSEKRHFLFYQDEAGFRSTGPNDEPGDWIYYLGVIDLFTPYSSVKRGEHWWKSLSGDSRMISAVPPKQYGNRFVKFLTAIVRPLKWDALPPGFDKIEPMEGVEEVGGGPKQSRGGKIWRRAGSGSKPREMEEKPREAGETPATAAASSSS